MYLSKAIHEYIESNEMLACCTVTLKKQTNTFEQIEIGGKNYALIINIENDQDYVSFYLVDLAKNICYWAFAGYAGLIEAKDIFFFLEDRVDRVQVYKQYVALRRKYRRRSTMTNAEEFISFLFKIVDIALKKMEQNPNPQ